MKLYYYKSFMTQSIPSNSPTRMKNRKILYKVLCKSTELQQEDVQKEVDLLLPLDPYAPEDSGDMNEIPIDEENLQKVVEYTVQTIGNTTDIQEENNDKDEVRSILEMLETLGEVIGDLETNELSIRKLQRKIDWKIDWKKHRLEDVELLEVLVDLMHALGITDSIIQVSEEYIAQAKKSAFLFTWKNSVKKIEKDIKEDESLGKDGIANLIKLQKRIEGARKAWATDIEINNAHIIKRLKNTTLPEHIKKDSV